MLIVLSKKGAYLALVVVIVAFGLRGFWRSQTPFDRFAALIAMVVLGYNTFLLFAYVTTFGKFDALRAASYWRYNMHLGALVVAFAGYGGAQLWHQKLAGRFDIRRLAWLPIALVVIAPFGFAHKLRFDRTPMTVHIRDVGAAVAEIRRVVKRGRLRGLCGYSQPRIYRPNSPSWRKQRLPVLRLEVRRCRTAGWARSPRWQRCGWTNDSGDLVPAVRNGHWLRPLRYKRSLAGKNIETARARSVAT